LNAAPTASKSAMSKATPDTATPLASDSSAATALTRTSSRPVMTTVAPAWARSSAVARPIPRVPPVTTTIRPARPPGVTSVIDVHSPQHVQSHLEAAHVDHLLGVELNAEFVLDRGHERHVPQRVPLLDVAVLQVLDIRTRRQLKRLGENLAQLVVEL